jgi:DNA-binding CsgD family transcriptional regulator
MERFARARRWGGIGLAAVGLALLALNLALGGIEFTLPLVFMMLGGAICLLVFFLLPQWRWAPALFIPGLTLAALGLVFLLNVLTGDWKSWAYAWLLVAAGGGLGLALSAVFGGWRPALRLAGIGLVLGGVTLFALFGAIAGGPVIQISAPLLLVLGGLALRWLKPETVLPERLLRRFDRPVVDPEPRPAELAGPVAAFHNGPVLTLPEPLTSREVEVLDLIAAGLTNQEIARRLTLAPSTVKTHINNIYGKLGVQSRVQAVQRARSVGVLK